MSAMSLKTYESPSVTNFGKMSELIEAGSLVIPAGSPLNQGNPNIADTITVDVDGNVTVTLDGIPVGPVPPELELSATPTGGGPAVTVFQYLNPLTGQLIDNLAVIQFDSGECFPATVNGNIVTLEGQGANEPTFELA